jgi:HPt (histidine-containing phosphotransfer) domain-containing protein
MRSGLAEGDVNRVIQSAHAMKGGAHSLGAMQVAQLCADIEERGRRGDVADLGQVVDLIEVILPRIGSALEARVAAIARTLAGT